LKNAILAALAATSLSFGAHAASPASPAAPASAVSPVTPVTSLPSEIPPEVRIAIDTIQHELKRRLEPGKGKPVRPDQPSAIAPTASEKAALRAVFGTEQPLSIKRTGQKGKVTQYAFTIPGHHYTIDTTTSTWQDAAVQIGIDAGGAATTGQWPGIEMHGLDYNLLVQDVSVTSRQPKAALEGSLRIQAGSIKFDDLTPSGTMHAEGVDFRVATTEKNKKLDQQSEFSIKRLTFADSLLIDDLHFALRLRDLNSDTLKKLDVSGLTPAQQPTVFLDELKTLLVQGASLELSDLSATFGGGKLRVQGSLGLPGVTLKDLATKEGVLNALDGRLRIELPTRTLRTIIQRMADKTEKSKDPQVLEKAAQETYAYVLGKILSEGYARLEQDKLVSIIEIKHGQLRIDGRPDAIALQDLLAMLDHKKSESPPLEEDHSAPVAVLWRDRSLDNLLLFGGNKNPEAIRALCIRSAVASNREQIQRWCPPEDIDITPDQITPAHLEQAPVIKDSTLSISKAAGYYEQHFFRFDTSKLRRMQVTLSNPQADEKWQPMLRLCLEAEAPSDHACLIFNWFAKTKHMRAVTQRYSADYKAISNVDTSDREFALGKPVTLQIYVDDHLAHFWIEGDDDGEELVQEITFPASLISLMCSTADCSFKFE
jgi:hypothetical protein